MTNSRQKTKADLRLVVSSERPQLPPVVTDRAARAEFEELTQRLVDIVIEITDLADGDPDLEPSGDEFEDGDGV